MMMSSKLSHLLVLILLSILTINPTQSSTSNPIYLTHICPNTTTFTQNSTFSSNLHLLLSSFSSAANHTLFLSADNPSTLKVYGLFLCRGDSTLKQCQDCVTFATSDILTRCPNQTTAVVWYDQCMVRYSNRSVFSVQPDTFMMYNTRNVSEPNRFNQLVANVMTRVISGAAASGSGDKSFATGSAVFSGFQTVYTLAQCTNDLSRIDCDRCLRTCMSYLPSCCDGKMGGRVLLPSCNVRYEVYPFYNEAVAAPASAPSPEIDSPAPIPFPADVGSEGKNSRVSSAVIVAVVAPIVVFVWILGLGICLVICNRRSRSTAEILFQHPLQDPNDHGHMIVTPKEEINDIPNAESLQFDLATIETATNGFDEDNKLGQGGFGEVYMGTLSTGEEIAVKRLSKGSGQGEEEFKNEVLLVAKLQHRNLVRLLGFCLEGDERILVYEFVPNKSLDHFLYEDERKMLLDWPSRHQIVVGIARGILYLHEDSRLKIIHRDLKASNILLDKDMKAKISDFGMARIFGVDQTQANTNRIVGTYGYMSPEYAMYGQFSAKSDVYSFGVLLLEIITGLKNSTFTKKDGAQDLLGYVWRNWRDGTPLEVMDATLLDSYSNNEVIRCIHIGLVCVQENPADRPTMATVVLMLSTGYSITQPMPKQPAFFSPTRVTGWSSTGLGGGVMQAAESDQCGCKSAAWSVNDASITDVYPR